LPWENTHLQAKSALPQRWTDFYSFIFFLIVDPEMQSLPGRVNT
jgi:hypothetical protein